MNELVNKLCTVSTVSLVLYWILNCRPIKCLYTVFTTCILWKYSDPTTTAKKVTVKTSQWKACYSKVHSEELCDCRITVSERDWFCFSIMSSCWSGRRSFSTSQTMSSLMEREKTIKQSQQWQHSPHLALPHPLPPCSPPLTHILFLLSLIVFPSILGMKCNILSKLGLWTDLYYVQLVWSHH